MNLTKKILCFDLDDTLLKFDKTISDYTLRVLKEWKRKGGKIIFATARIKSKTIFYSDKIGIDGLVSLRGAIGYSNNVVVCENYINKDVVCKLFELCKEHDDCYMSVFLEDSILTNYKPFLSHGDCEFFDFSKGITQNVTKILFLSTKYLSDDLLNMLNSLTRYTIDPIFSSYSIYDKKSDKIYSIKRVSEALGVDLKNVICFGNDDNDIEMIKGCGVGIAVANSTKHLLEEADYICESNDDDGPAKWIEKNYL